MKKQIMKKITVLAVALALVFSSSPAFSFGVDAEEEGRGGWRRQEKGQCTEETKEKREKFIEELGLTEEQQEEMKDLKEANREKRKELRETLKEKKEELKEELSQYSSSTRKIQGLVSEVKDLQGELIDLRVDSIMGMKEILTEEQFKKFTAGMKKSGKGQHRQKGNKKHRRR